MSSASLKVLGIRFISSPQNTRKGDPFPKHVVQRAVQSEEDIRINAYHLFTPDAQSLLNGKARDFSLSEAIAFGSN